MSGSPQNPNVATLQTGLGRSSRRTGNRIDRYAERVWMTRQMVTFPYGAVPICISIARTYYTRSVLLGILYLMAHRGVIVPGALFFILGVYALWEAVMFAYLWSSTPKFDLCIRAAIAGGAVLLIYGQLFEGLCRA
jgi:hypothetical protein